MKQECYGEGNVWKELGKEKDFDQIHCTKILKYLNKLKKKIKKVRKSSLSKSNYPNYRLEIDLMAIPALDTVWYFTQRTRTPGSRVNATRSDQRTLLELNSRKSSNV